MDLFKVGGELDIEPFVFEETVHLVGQLKVGVEVEVDVLFRFHPGVRRAWGSTHQATGCLGGLGLAETRMVSSSVSQSDVSELEGAYSRAPIMTIFSTPCSRACRPTCSQYAAGAVRRASMAVDPCEKKKHGSGAGVSASRLGRSLLVRCCETMLSMASVITPCKVRLVMRCRTRGIGYELWDGETLVI